MQYQQARFHYAVNVISRRVIKRDIFHQKYHKEVNKSQAGNDKIYELIMSGKPFMAGRFGGNELRTCAEVLYEKSGGKFGGLNKTTRGKLRNVAGFFSDEPKYLYQFEELTLDVASKQVDVLGVWDMFLMGEITKRYVHDAYYTELRAMEPYYFSNPWSRALEGKKVLVIHPFVETIRKQYERRDKIFADKNVLPEFELLTLKSVQTAAGTKDERYETWFDALEDMYQQAMKMDFDIALVGCGAYGYPLAAKIKASGKQVIHMGGALQILFGIKGNRWEKHEFISKLFNEYWVRPSDNEGVKASNLVEKSCYW